MNKWLITVTVMLPTLIEIMDMTAVNVALGHIRGSLSAGIDESTWAITSYLVSNAVIIPLSGWLSRFFGRKKYLIISVTLFTVSSFLCGSAWSLNSLVFFRVLQGIGGGALQPISQAILLETFPPQQRGMAMAIFGIGIMFGPIMGPLLGGLITDNWSWHWVFFINIPIGIVSVLMTIFFIFDPPYMKRMKMKIDYLGLIFLTLGVGCLQVVLDKGQREEWFSSSFIVWLSIISSVSLLLFIIREFFTEEPVINLKTFKDLSFSMGCIVMFCVFFNLFGSIILQPIYVQTLMGYTATLAGVVLAPGGIASMFTMQIVGRLINRINPKAFLIIGIIVCSYATYLMSKFNLYADFYSIALPRIILGIGMGLTVIPLITIAFSTIKKEEMANATAIYNFLRNLGGSFGVAFVTTMLSRRAQFHQSHLVEHLTPFNTPYQIITQHSAQILELRGFESFLSEYAGLNAVYKELLRQSSMLSFNDTFYLTSIILIAILPLAFLMKRSKELSPQKFH
ncbi:MAG: DHA2 family efflux MFS transporter permease subunit [Nitrospirae bacterium]|nr:DHA2 family efflux MFS transporter permease subunit [Nitrospirota bacterium]